MSVLTEIAKVAVAGVVVAGLAAGLAFVAWSLLFGEERRRDR